MEKLNVTLLSIQCELNAPKGQRNSFGKYNYRSAEDILEAVKPLLKKHEANLIIHDQVELVGDRYYIKATATLLTKEGSISASAYAREELTKKGMDSAQITGATSSYARKYALNGLLAIDDNKDPDTDEFAKRTSKKTDESKLSFIPGKEDQEQASKIKTKEDFMRFVKEREVWKDVPSFKEFVKPIWNKIK